MIKAKIANHREVSCCRLSNQRLPARYAVFILGLVLSALGISLITKPGLGTSPVSSIAYVFTFIYPLSFGTYTLLSSIAMILAQVAVLRRSFQKIQLLQLPATLVFSACIDLFMRLFSFWQPGHYAAQAAVLLLGCMTLGLGVALQVFADALMLPSEGLVKAITQKLGAEFGTVKTVYDCSMVCATVVISLLFTGRVNGVREGTLIAALTVGTFSKLFRKAISQGKHSQACHE